MSKSDGPGAKKILLAGYFGFDNTGDEAILGVLLEDLRSKLGDFEIVVASGKPEETSATHGVKSVSYTNISGLISEVESSSAVMFGGGGIFHDYWGCDPDLSLTNQHTGIAYYHSLVLLAALLEKPLVISAVGVGPLLSEAGRKYTRMAFEQASQASVRDQESKELLVSAGVDPDHVKVSADHAFRVLPIPSDQAEVILQANGLAPSSQLLIGVTPREWHIGASVEQWGGEVAAALDDLIERQEATVMFLPFQCLESDLTNDYFVSLMIRSYMRHQERAIVLTGNYTVQEKAGLLAQCDVVLGMRLHSIIFAANAGVPTVALAYDPKIESVMKQLKCEEFAVAIDALEASKLVERIIQARRDSADLRERLLLATRELAVSARENNLCMLDWLQGETESRFTLGPEQVRLAARNAISLVNDRGKMINSVSAELAEKESVIVERDKSIKWLQDELAKKESIIVERDKSIKWLQDELVTKESIIVERDKSIKWLQDELVSKESIIVERDKSIKWLQDELV
ncbi:MAG: polysaccharide pyruvyl transferase family protein, partial [Acidobacteriota bacterium]